MSYSNYCAECGSSATVCGCIFGVSHNGREKITRHFTINARASNDPLDKLLVAFKEAVEKFRRHPDGREFAVCKPVDHKKPPKMLYNQRTQDKRQKSFGRRKRRKGRR